MYSWNQKKMFICEQNLFPERRERYETREIRNPKIRAFWPEIISRKKITLSRVGILTKCFQVKLSGQINMQSEVL